MCCLLLLLLIPFGNAWAKQPKFNVNTVSEISLDVVRIDACARKKGCTVASGPMQLNLLDLAEGNVDFANQVLLPARTKELRLILGDNSTITVDNEIYPLSVPSGQPSGLKLKGRKHFAKEGGFLSNLTLNLNLKKKLVVRAKKIKSKKKVKGKKNRKDETFVYSYKLKPVIKVQTAEVTPLPENMAAVVALPDEDNEITIGDNFSLFIPAGAVSAPVVIAVKETKYTVEVMDEETGVVVEKPALSSSYELSPDGSQFAVPLVITLPYYPDVLPSDVSEYDLAVYLDEERVPTDIDTVSKIATADVWHFTSARVSYYTPICPNGNGLYCGTVDSFLNNDTLYYCQNGNYQALEYCSNGCETMPSGTNDRCSSGTNPQPFGNFVFPFAERDSVWQICQGYNTPNISHFGNLIHSFDFAYGSGNLGNTGCLGNPGGSEDKTVIAPAAGTILWNGATDTDITCFHLENTVSNGHGDQIASVKLGHMKNNSARVSAGKYRAQGEPIGKLCGPTGCPSSGPYTHTHIAAYITTNCTGVTVPFGTVFGSGYPDFSSNGSKYQWHGTEIPSGDVLSDDELVLKEVRVTANGTLYAGDTATYTAVADLAENITTGSLPIPGDVVKTIEVTNECTWLATPTMYATSLGNGLVQANAGTAGQAVKVKCSYYHSPSNIQLTGTLPVVVSDGYEPTSCPSGNGLYCGKSSLNQNTNT
ncbi:MAG: DUF4382 domain-containing protein, partial [Candidatus Electrothrix sp. AR3]|nr:DUF4382 domain-containing protein [Candidatus Electrothrix sp. AR3]